MLTPERLRELNEKHDKERDERNRGIFEEMEWRAITAGKCNVNDKPPRRLMSEPETLTNNYSPVYSQRVVAALANAPEGMPENTGGYTL